MSFVPFPVFAVKTCLFRLELISKASVSSQTRLSNALPEGAETLDVATILLRW